MAQIDKNETQNDVKYPRNAQISPYTPKLRPNLRILHRHPNCEKNFAKKSMTPIRTAQDEHHEGTDNSHRAHVAIDRDLPY